MLKAEFILKTNSYCILLILLYFTLTGALVKIKRVKDIFNVQRIQLPVLLLPEASIVLQGEKCIEIVDSDLQCFHNFANVSYKLNQASLLN